MPERPAVPPVRFVAHDDMICLDEENAGYLLEREERTIEHIERLEILLQHCVP